MALKCDALVAEAAWTRPVTSVAATAVCCCSRVVRARACISWSRA